MTLLSTESSRPEARSHHEDSIVTVKNLRVCFKTIFGTSQALDGIDLQIPRGKVLGVVGESGCGKSMTGQAIMQIIPQPGKVDSGEILFRAEENSEPVDILAYDRFGSEMRSIRGAQIGMIFQEPMTSLNPCYTIGDQILEAVMLHNKNRAEAKQQVLEILHRVDMPNPTRVYSDYPHQLSGGMRQRAMIAMALSCKPHLLIADEPTTALDVTTEAQILELVRELQNELGMSTLYITHNMGVVAQMADRVAVMYLGKIVEEATVYDIFSTPRHPYTISLLRSIPFLGASKKEQLESIKGTIPDPYTRITGCPFHPRCPSFIPGLCDVTPPQVTVLSESQQHRVRCHHYSE